MDAISQIRSFSRSYTQVFGLLNNQILDSPLSLTESRIIYELAAKGESKAKSLSHVLNVNKGYLSRTLKKLIKNGYIIPKLSESDRRVKNLCLTQKGKEIFKFIDQGSRRQIEKLLVNTSSYEQNRLKSFLGQAQQIIEKDNSGLSITDIKIRNELIAGDMGFVIQSHGELYKHEYNHSILFEKYVAEGILEYIGLKKPNKNRVWVCEHNSNRVGFLLLIDRGKTAQLRYFFVFPEYRGIGIGSKLMSLFVKYLREQKFESCYLWTTHELTNAAILYRKYGFNLIEEKESFEFGKQLIEQKYILQL